MYDECTIKKRKRKKINKKAKARVCLFSLLAVIALVFVYVFAVVYPVVVKLSEEKIRALSTSIISTSIGDVLTKENLSYDDIVNIQYDNNNNITLISTDSVEINLLVREVTKLVQSQMDKLGNESVGIALGTFTGIPFLYGRGPNIDIKLVPVGTVSTLFDSEFIGAGINQTRHQLKFDITINIGMILPGKTHNFKTELEVLLCESIIVGKIPEIYLQGKLL